MWSNRIGLGLGSWRRCKHGPVLVFYVGKGNSQIAGRFIRCERCGDKVIHYTKRPSAQRITHGRHCACSACRREDWTNSDLAPCGMHGKSCPRSYQPWGTAGDTITEPPIRSDG